MDVGFAEEYEIEFSVRVSRARVYFPVILSTLLIYFVFPGSLGWLMGLAVPYYLNWIT